MGALLSITERSKIFSPSIPYVYDSLLFAIPPGKPYSSLEKLLFPFKATVWMCICTSFLLMAIAIRILKLISKRKLNFVIGRNIDAPMLNLFKTCLGGTMTEFQLPKRNFARTILGIVFLTTLILRNAYLGNLFNFLRAQKRTEPLYYTRNVFDSDVEIFIPELYFAFQKKRLPSSVHHR